MSTTKMNSARLYPIPRPVPGARDLPATQEMLYLVQNGLRAEMRAGFKRIEARLSGHDAQFKSIDARFNEVNARFNEVDARFNNVDARFDQMESKIELVLAEVSRIGVLVEEQNSRNNLVLEHSIGLQQRQDRLEARMDEVERTVRSIARSKP